MSARFLVRISVFCSAFILIFCFVNFKTKDTESKIILNKTQIKLAKKIYSENCAKCHGSKAKGNNYTPGFTTKQLDNYLATQIIVRGKNKMPAFGNVLSNGEIALVTQYLKTFYTNTYDSNYIKKAIIGTYVLRPLGNSISAPQTLQFNTDNTYTHIFLKNNEIISGKYLINDAHNIILTQNLNKIHLLIALTNIKNIKNELQIIDIYKQTLDSTYVFIKQKKK